MFTTKRPRFSHRHCPHCDNLLNVKTFKEHKRLFFDRDTKLWHRVPNTVSGESSLSNEEEQKRATFYTVSLCYRRQMTMTGTVAIPVNKKKLNHCLPNLLIMNHSLRHINSENTEREYGLRKMKRFLQTSKTQYHHHFHLMIR